MLMKNDLVSVIIPTYNRFEYLQDAIKSVKDQKYHNLEIIVINDGSDQKEYYEEEFPNDVKIINLKENQKKINGFSSDSIRNIGVKEAQGKYLAFLDDDDIWLKGKLETQIEKMKDTNCKISSTDGFFGNGRFNESEIFKKKIKNYDRFINFYLVSEQLVNNFKILINNEKFISIPTIDKSYEEHSNLIKEKLNNL